MSTNSSSLLHWSVTSSAINRYIPLPLLICGTFGNLINILVFTRKPLRENSCVQYLLASTIGSFFALYVGMMARLLNGYGQDYTSYSSALCKIRYFITYLSLAGTSWFISFGCIDRYCSSSKSVQLRSWCKNKNCCLCCVSYRVSRRSDLWEKHSIVSTLVRPAQLQRVIPLTCDVKSLMVFF